MTTSAITPIVITPEMIREHGLTPEEFEKIKQLLGGREPTRTELGIFSDVPKVRAWRTELAQCPSVRNAVGADYPQLLRAFLVRHDAHLLKVAA